MDTTTILMRLKQSLSLKTDKALADYLGISATVISNWKTRGISDWEIIFSKCECIDLNWLIRGESPQNEGKQAELQMLRERVAQLEEQNREFLSIIKNLSAK